MSKRANIIPKAAMARILTNSGAGRVASKAAEHFAEVMEEIGLRIAEKSIRMAKHAGRKTVHDVDIKLAAKKA